MYGLLLAVATPGQALGAVALNRVALTLVELLVLLVGGLLLRGAREPGERGAPIAPRSPPRIVAGHCDRSPDTPDPAG